MLHIIQTINALRHLSKMTKAFLHPKHQYQAHSKMLYTCFPNVYEMIHCFSNVYVLKPLPAPTVSRSESRFYNQFMVFRGT